MIQFFQNPTISSLNFSFNPSPNLSQKCSKSKISSKPTLIPISYHHITLFHHPNTLKSVMNPPQSKGTSIKHTAVGTLKEHTKGQSSRSSPSKRPREASSSVPPQLKRPRSTASNVAAHTPLFWNSLQKKRYDMLQRTKYSCGRQILWNVFAFANFYTELHAYFVKMS